MAVEGFAEAKLSARLMLLCCLAACNKSAPGTVPGAIGGPAGTGAATCVAGQTTTCTTVTCAPGAVATAVCGPTGVPGPCMCPAAAPTGAAGTPAAVGGSPAVAGTGAAGMALVTAGSSGTGTPAPAAAGGGGAAGTGMAGTGAMMTTPTANNWPQMGYDANNNYFNPKETKLSLANAAMLKEKWRFTIAGYPPGTPVIGDGKVFVMATGGSYGINLADGTKAWERLDLPGTATMAYDNGFVYAHTYTGPNLYKLKASDGSTVWGPIQTNMNGDCDGMSSPIFAGGMVIVGHSCGALEVGGDVTNARGGVEAFDTETGARKWSYFTVPATGENGAMVWSSVSIDLESKVVFAGTGNNYSVQGENSDAIHAVDMLTGMRKWKKQVHDNDVWSLLLAPGGPDTDFGANPILATIDGKKIVANGDKGSFFHVMDRETGVMIWQRGSLSSKRNQANGGILMNGAWDGKYFYVVANEPPGKAVLHALDPAKMGADAWPAKMLPKLTWGAPALANGVLIVPNDDDVLVMNAMTGEVLKMFNTGGTIAAGSPAIVDGNVVVPSGLQYELDATVKPNNQIICYSVP